MHLDLDSTNLELLPGLAVLLPASRTLVVADVHLGKSAAFRARGLAVPEGDTRRDLERLRVLAGSTASRRLVLAGDLFHSPAGLTPEIEDAIAAWLDGLGDLGIPVTLVLGNHDRKLRHLPGGLATADALDCDGIAVVHDPADAEPGTPTLAGHLHPVARIADGRRTSLRLPCFHLRDQLLTLPAFGSFTGGRIVEPRLGDRLFVAPGDRVLEVPADLWR